MFLLMLALVFTGIHGIKSLFKYIHPFECHPIFFSYLVNTNTEDLIWPSSFCSCCHLVNKRCKYSRRLLQTTKVGSCKNPFNTMKTRKALLYNLFFFFFFT